MLNFKYNSDSHVYGMGAPTLHHYPPALGGNYPFSPPLQRPSPVTSLGCVYGAAGLGYPDWGLATPHPVTGCGSTVSVSATNIFSREAQTQGYRPACTVTSPPPHDTHPTQGRGDSATATLSATQGSCSGGVNPLTVVSSSYSAYGSTSYLAVTSSAEDSADGGEDRVTETAGPAGSHKSTGKSRQTTAGGTATMKRLPVMQRYQIVVIVIVVIVVVITAAVIVIIFIVIIVITTVGCVRHRRRRRRRHRQKKF